MTPIRSQLLDLIVQPDAYDQPPARIRPLQLEAARELFAQRREQIPVLRRRAEESGCNGDPQLRRPRSAAVLAHRIQILSQRPGRTGALGPALAVAEDSVSGRPHDGGCQWRNQRG